VLHRSGEEGLDELWGEPFKAFAFPIEDFYNSRYIKIAQSMQAIDTLAGELIETFAGMSSFAGLEPLLRDFALAAKIKCETLRTDEDIFDVWTSLVVSAEKLAAFRPLLPADASTAEHQQAGRGTQLILDGKNIVLHVTRARVPMPKTAEEFVDRCRTFRQTHVETPARIVA
jgi:hypothetical protein